MQANIPNHIVKIDGVRAVLWDVYGTLLQHLSEMGNPLLRKDMVRRACELTAKEFGFEDFLDGNPAQTLQELFHHEVEKEQERKRKRGIFSPEIRIERVWLKIIEDLERKGYKPSRNGGTLGLALKVAYFFDDVIEEKALYPGAVETLQDIKDKGLHQGIISNAQFYTPITLDILFRQQGVNDAHPIWHFFDKRLVFFSYHLGVSKPNPLAFELARSRLKKIDIQPSQVVFVGNDVLNDMVTARKVGIKCVLFAGDKESLTLREEHPECADFKPDGVIKSLPHLLEIIG